MKKILQDLSFAETEEKVLSLGEKKFRAKQLFEGLMQGRRIPISRRFRARSRRGFWRNTRTNPSE